jgi:hypothetical protein
VLNCSFSDAVSLEQSQRMKHPAIFVNLGSGRTGFSMGDVQSRQPGETAPPRRHVIARIGHQPVVQYVREGEYAFHSYVADGYVGNLSRPRPTIPAYSTLTNLLAIEAIREANDHLEKGVTGAQPLTSVRIENAPREKAGRELVFFKRGEDPDAAALRYLINGKRATRDAMWATEPDASYHIVMSEAVVWDISDSLFGPLARTPAGAADS